MSFENADEEAADNCLTLYQSLFDMTQTLCKVYPAISPLSIRKERAKEVFLLIRRINTHPRTNDGVKANEGKAEIVRRPAGDKWF